MAGAVMAAVHRQLKAHSGPILSLPHHGFSFNLPFYTLESAPFKALDRGRGGGMHRRRRQAAFFKKNSPGGIRTCDQSVNSRPLYH